MSVASVPALANLPSWDNSGNSLLNGTYYFREVTYQVSDNAGDLSRAFAAYGNITFNGNGGYSFSNATVVDSNSQQLFSLGTVSGNYSIAGSGHGFFPAPLITGAQIYGLVSNGIFIGSMTESGYIDLFIAVPISSPAPTAASFQGSYTVNGFIPGGTPSAMSDATFQLNPDGAGNLGTVNISGYFGGNSNALTQSSPAIKYTFSNGAGIITFPNSNTANFYVGQEYMYISPDHNFIFGGSPNGFDMFVGVKNATGAVNQTGLYYEAGLDEDASQLSASGFGAIDAFYGSFNAAGGNIVGHERLYTPLFNSAAEGFTYSSTYPTSISNGTYSAANNTIKYTFGNSGAIRISFGLYPFLNIGVAMQAPTPTGSGVFLNPQGVTDAASFSPFTAGVSPGEFIVLYGSGFASGTTIASKLPYPTTLGNVQVLINGTPAPLYYVTPTQIAAIVPYNVSYTPTNGVLPIAGIQVINNNAPSNLVTQFIAQTTPGIFSLTANGLNDGAIEHGLTGQVVTAKSPAAPGEVVSIFMSGLGATQTPITEGTASTTTDNSVATISAYIGGNQATVAYAGLAPFLAGLYQVNVTVPANTTAGENTVEILGPDSDSFQATIAVGSTTGTSSAIRGAQPKVVRHSRVRANVQKPGGCFVFDSACGARF